MKIFMLLLYGWFSSFALCAGTTNKSKIIHVVSDDFYLLTTPKEGVPGKGLLVDITQAVLNEMGFQMVYTSIPWKRSLQLVESGKEDIILASYRTPERSKVYHFQEFPIYQDIIHIYTHREKSQIQKIDQCQSLGVMLGWSYGPRIDQVIKSKRVESFSFAEKGLQMISKKRLDCFLLNQDIANRTLKGQKPDSVVYSELVADKVGIYNGFSKRGVKSEFVKLYNQTFDHLLLAGKLKDTYEKYGPEFLAFHDEILKERKQVK